MSQFRHWPGCGLGKVTGSSFHTQEKHSLYPFVQQIFPECLLGSEMVLSDTKDVKEGPALCSRSRAGGNAGGEGAGQGPWAAGRARAKLRQERLVLEAWGRGRLESGRRGVQGPRQGKPRHQAVPRACAALCGLLASPPRRGVQQEGGVVTHPRDGRRGGRHEMEVEPPTVVGRPGPREGGGEERGVGGRGRGCAGVGGRRGGRARRLCTVVLKPHSLCSEPYLKCKSPGPSPAASDPRSRARGPGSVHSQVGGQGPHPETRGTDGERHTCEART